MTAVVFLCPSLALAEARAALDAHYLPPARQGDVYRALRDLRPSVIGIVDGLFHQTPSVWHKEILFAMAQGVTIFGAASMGALRAAELCAFGMRGVGTIFEAYRDGVYPPYAAPFERDDEVALIHGPPETGFAALSDALVDMRATLAEAAEAGVIDSGLRDALVARAGAIYYQDRSYDALLEGADGLPEAAIEIGRAHV